MMSMALNSPASCSLFHRYAASNPAYCSSASCLLKLKGKVKRLPSSLPTKRNVLVKAFFLNPADEPIIKEALKEPVAFMGGMFAGLLKLDLNEDPLKEWVARTVEASGIAEDDVDAEGSITDEEIPQQIEIE